MIENNKRYIAFDVETGGLGNDVSLLTAYFCILNNKLEIINELDLSLKPDDSIYKVTAEGLLVNNINIVELEKKAITYKEAKSLLFNFLKNNYRDEKFIPIGQNIIFDVLFIKNTIISSGSWDQFVSNKPLDTMYIARFLKETGKYDDVKSISLSNLVEYFDISVPGNPHEAKYDTLASIEVLKRMLN